MYSQVGAGCGPEIQGTTDRLIAGQFFIRDEQLTPPDLHHAAGGCPRGSPRLQLLADPLQLAAHLLRLLQKRAEIR